MSATANTPEGQTAAPPQASSAQRPMLRRGGRSVADPEADKAKIPAKRKKASRAELAFLPAALEVLETPPSPTIRVMALALGAFVVIAVAWAMIGGVDIVAVARGKIVPKGQVKVIQPLEPGVVREIGVREGERVAAGQVLIELDPTEATADRERLATDLMAAEVRAARLEAMLSFLAGDRPAFQTPETADERLVDTHRRMLESQIREHRARRSSLDKEMLRLAASLRSAEAEVQRGERLLPIADEEATVYGKLSRNGMASRSEYLDAAERLVTIEQDLLVQRARAEEAVTGLSAITEERRLIEAEARREALSELADTNERIEGLTQELTKAEQRGQRRRLLAPIDGTVQRLAVHTVGGVVTQAQELMVVVPGGRELEIEAWVENKDIAFVAAGQPAEIKVETLPFTKYGLVEGRVEQVSADAVVQGANAQGQGAEREAPPDGLVYLAKVSLAETEVRADGRDVPLVPGMSVTVETRTGERKLIEYLLSPLLRYRHDAVRER